MKDNSNRRIFIKEIMKLASSFGIFSVAKIGDGRLDKRNMPTDRKDETIRHKSLQHPNFESLPPNYLDTNKRFVSDSKLISHNIGDEHYKRSVHTRLSDNIYLDDFGKNDDKDDTQAFNRAISYLKPKGGKLTLPNRIINISEPITIDLPQWSPILIEGQGGSTIHSSHDGVVLSDNTGNIRLQNVQFVGPGKHFNGSIALKSILSQGWVRGCKFSRFMAAIEINNSTNVTIDRNHFTLCLYGILSNQSYPSFSNAIEVHKNWFDFCDIGISTHSVIGLTIDSNVFEYNAVGFECEATQLIDITGCNWFENNTLFGFQLKQNCSGQLGFFNHFVGSTFFIHRSNTRFINFKQPKWIMAKSNSHSFKSNSRTILLNWHHTELEGHESKSTSSPDIYIDFSRSGYFEIILNLDIQLNSTVYDAGAKTSVYIEINNNIQRKIGVHSVDGRQASCHVSLIANLTEDSKINVAYKHADKDIVLDVKNIQATILIRVIT